MDSFRKRDRQRRLLEKRQVKEARRKEKAYLKTHPPTVLPPELPSGSTPLLVNPIAGPSSEEKLT